MNEKLPIIIQGAMKPELDILIEKLNNIEKICINGYDFYKGKINNYPIIISKTDVGIINVTASTITAINSFNPVCIINQGIAGAIDEKVHKGDIVIGEKCININSYQTPFLGKGQGSNSLNWELKTFKEGIDELVELNCDTQLLQIIKEYIKQYEYISKNVDYRQKEEIEQLKNEDIKFGIIGSGDVWNGEYDKMKMLNEKYNIICEDMETIGVYQICKRLNTKVIGIRAISDNALIGENYERENGKKSQKFVLEILKQIINKIESKEE